MRNLIKHTTLATLAALAAILMLTATPTWAASEPQIINLPLSRPGDPVTLEISILSAYIEVIGEDRQDAEFSVTVEDGDRKIITPSGTKPLTGGAYSLQVDEQDNRLSVDTDWRANKVRIIARIPRRANLELSTTNNGEIVVANITGSMELENTNGPITASNISGSVIAESVNQAISISFASIDETSAMSLSSVNGDLTLGIPKNAGVQLHIDTARGEIISDFEVDVQPTKPVVKRDTKRGGVEVSVESVIIANVNGGGSIIKLKTLNGDIQIKKSDY